MNYDDYVSKVQRISAWTGGVVGGLLAFTWGCAKIGVGAGILFGACGAFAGVLVGAVAGWMLVPHVMLISLGVLAAAALPFGIIWLAGMLWHLR